MMFISKRSAARIQLESTYTDESGSVPEKRLYHAIIKTYIDDALELRSRLNKCADINEWVRICIRREIDSLKGELGSQHSKSLCDLAGISHSKLVKTVNQIIDGGQ